MIFEIHRLVDSPKELQLGVMKIDGVPCFTTAELPWRNNARGVSGIPGGGYKARRVSHHKFGTTYLVDDVAGRDGIYFHAGNFPHDTEGCILLGMGYQNLDGLPTILNSKRAMKQFVDQTVGAQIVDLYIWDI